MTTPLPQSLQVEVDGKLRRGQLLIYPVNGSPERYTYSVRYGPHQHDAVSVYRPDEVDILTMMAESALRRMPDEADTDA